MGVVAKGKGSLGWNNLWLPPASQAVETQFQWFVNQAEGFTNDARGFVSDLSSFTITPITLNEIVFDTELTFTPFDKPVAPQFEPPVVTLGTAPMSPAIVDPEFSGLNSVRKPTMVVPATPAVNIPTAPDVTPIYFDDTAPHLTEVAIPESGTYLLPDVPTLISLNIPDAPDIDIDSFLLERPDFVDPTAYLYTNDYIKNAGDARAAIFDQVDDAFGAAQTEFGLRDAGGDKALTRLGTMLDGGTGLPPAIEQALFDRGISREEISSQQAVVQASDEWAARGFSLPGATLLARVREIRQANRDNRGQINRDITIKFHETEIENLRFAVQQGIALQGQMFGQYLQMHTAGREMADKAFAVAQAIFEARIEIFRVHLQIYQADIDAFKSRLQVELAKLDIFRAQLEGEKLRGEINVQAIGIYTAQIQAVETQVSVFKAQVEAANSQISAQASKVDLFRGKIEAYKTSLQGEEIKFNIFDSRVKAEESKVRVFSAQVQAYAEGLRGYQTEAQVEVSKIEARNKDNESRTSRYRTEIDAWRAGVTTQIENLQALTQVFQAEVGAYNAELGAEGARLQGESRNVELVLESERAKLGAKLKVGDQRIEEMKHATSIGLETIRTAAQTLSQLAASAMAAVNVSAGISNSLGSTTSWGSSYSESGAAD